MASTRGRKTFNFLPHIVLLLLCAAEARGFRTGANPKVCNETEMKPEHQLSAGFITNNEGKFEIRVTPTEYDPTNTDSAGKLLYQLGLCANRVD